MLITDTTIETEPIEKTLKWFAENQAGFSNRVNCQQKIDSIVQQAYKAARIHCLKDLSDWGDCEIEHFINAGDLSATIDLLLSDAKRRKALIVDWKRVGTLNTDKIWHYTKGPQPLVYTWLVSNLLPDYEVTFEFRFMVGNDKEPRRIQLNFEQDQLDAAMNEYTSRREAMEQYNDTRSWPKNASSCNDYRTLCVFAANCWGDKHTPSPYVEQILMTQSLIQVMDQCPRKYAETLAEAERQEKDFHDVGTPNQYALWGTMFHIAVSNMYQQIIERNKK